MLHRRGSAGQALIEFAIIFPIFLVLMMAIFDFGRVVWAQNDLASAAREGARFAIVHGGATSDACPVGPLSPDYSGVIGGSCGHATSPSKQAIKDAALSTAFAGGAGLTVTVCYGTPCTGDTDHAGSDGNNTRGNPVTVKISSSIPLTVPSLLGFAGFSVSGDSTMIVNH